jgi:tRNA pseudouridine-54 N-methylase
MDLISRCIIAAFNTPRGIRRDAILEIVLEGMPNPPITMVLAGKELERAPEGELEAANLIYDSLSGREAKGVSLKRRGFQETVRLCAKEGYKLYYLHEEGKDSRKASFVEKPAFILGDQKGLDPASERFLDEMKAERIGLGPYSYLASHCITLVNCELDKVYR